MFPRGGVDLRFIDVRYQTIKEKRKRQVTSTDQLSTIEKNRWDLDDNNRKPKGKKYPWTWKYDSPIRNVNDTRKSERNDARRNKNIRDGPDTEGMEFVER